MQRAPPGLWIREYEASLLGDQLEKSPLLLPPRAATQTVLAAAGTSPKGTGCHPGLLGPEVMPENCSPSRKVLGRGGLDWEKKSRKTPGLAERCHGCSVVGD